MNVKLKKCYTCTPFFLVFSFVLLVLFATLLVNVSLRKSSKVNLDADRVLSDYQFLEFNSNTNKSTTGIVSNFEDLEPQEFTSYQSDRNGKYVLISNFVTEEFKCTGSCFCYNTRRFTGTLAKRGIIYLVAAMSSLLAVDKAKEYFSSHCISELSGTCATTSSEVESCEPIVSTRTTRSEYLCRGTCLDNQRLKSHPDGVRAIEKYHCERMTYESVLVMTPSEVNNGLEKAKYRFIKDYLDPYCRIETKYSYKRGGIIRDVWLFVPMCIGEDKISGTNPTVLCRKILS